MLDQTDIQSVITDIASTLQIQQPSPLQKIDETLFSHSRLWVKRDDLLHPIISGNKWRKLQVTLAKSILNNHKHVISFGGGHSNHLHALSYACKALQLRCTCLIRGNYQNNITPTIDDLQQWGSEVVYVSKQDYMQRYDAKYAHQICQHYGADTVIPEGGSSHDGIIGVASLFDELRAQGLPEVIVLPVGSAGTLAGLLKRIYDTKANPRVIGISVLKAGDSHEKAIAQLFPPSTDMENWEILKEYHHGGYAKQTEQLVNFRNSFNEKLGFDLDPVYNAKSFYALNQEINAKRLLDKASICIIQTGGNQGARAKKVKKVLNFSS